MVKLGQPPKRKNGKEKSNMEIVEKQNKSLSPKQNIEII
jgi:hypothetical protein